MSQEIYHVRYKIPGSYQGPAIRLVSDIPSNTEPGVIYLIDDFSLNVDGDEDYAPGWAGLVEKGDIALAFAHYWYSTRYDVDQWACVSMTSEGWDLEHRLSDANPAKYESFSSYEMAMARFGELVHEGYDGPSVSDCIRHTKIHSVAPEEVPPKPQTPKPQEYGLWA